MLKVRQPLIPGSEAFIIAAPPPRKDKVKVISGSTHETQNTQADGGI